MSTAPTAETEQPQDGLSRSPLGVITLAALISGIFCFGFAIASYVNTGFYSRYLADDYCIAAHLHDRGFLGAQEYWYNAWTGRFAYVFVSDLVPFIGTSAMPFFAPLVIISLFAAAIWACYQAGRVLFGGGLVLPSILVAGVIVFGYLSLLPDRNDGLYWLSGGSNYTAPLVLFALNAGCIVWGVNAGSSGSRVAGVAVLLLAFVSSGFAETFIVWQLTLIFCIGLLVLCFGTGRQRESLLSLLSTALAGALIATVIVVLAPGNDSRQGSEGPTGGVAYALQHSVTDSARLFGELLIKPQTLLAAAITLVITAVQAARPPDMQRLDLRQIALRGALVLAITYLLLLATHMPGYYFLAKNPPDRALATGVLSVILGAMCLGYLAGRSLGPQFARIEARPRVLTVLAVVSILLIAAVALTPAVQEFSRTEELSAYASAWDLRDQQLQQAAAANARDVTVPLLAHASDLEMRTTPGIWINRCAAFYYGLRSIVAE